MRAAGFPLRAAAAALACILAVAPAKAGADDGKALSAEVEPLVQAVRAEIERARTELALGEAPPPHFISVAIVETRTLKVTARNGALLESAENRTSQGYLDLRVGSYELDQTNFSSGDPFGAYGAARPFCAGFDHDVGLPTADFHYYPWSVNRVFYFIDYTMQ